MYFIVYPKHCLNSECKTTVSCSMYRAFAHARTRFCFEVLKYGDMTTKREHKFVNIHTTSYIDVEILIIIICKGKPCSKHNKGNKIEKENTCMLIQYYVRKPLKEHINKIGSVRTTLWRVRVSSRTRKHVSVSHCRMFAL
jgi:hypothetical protein